VSRHEPSRLRSGALALGFAATTLVACGGTDGPGASRDLVALRDTYAHGCERAHACRDEYSGFLPFETLFQDSVDACESTYDGFVDYLAARVAEGALAYDEALAARCRDRALDVFECAEVFATSADAECDDVLSGLQGSGEDCLLDVECLSEECDVDEATNEGACR
jgi:hypothetical protein